MNTTSDAPASNLSIMLLQNELTKRGFTAEVYPFKDEFVVFKAPNGWTWLTRMWALNYPFIPHAVQVLAKNKYLAYEFAERMGVTIPKTLEYPADDTAITALLDAYAPLIAKPLDSSGSRGITLNIRSLEEAKTAAAAAQRFSSTVLLQQQVQGSEVRFTIVDGEVVSVFHRSTARVTGDGRSTVQELIQADNDARKLLSMPYLQYPQLDATIIDESYLTDQSVPAAGEAVELSKSSLISGGASLYDISQDIDQSYVATARMLANKLNPAFLIVDMLIEDYRQPQTETNYSFLEFNTAPVLRMYYSIRDGRPYDMVSKIADMIEAESRR